MTTDELRQLIKHGETEIRQVTGQVKSLILCLFDKELPKTKLLDLARMQNDNH